MQKHRIFIAIDLSEGLKSIAEVYLQPFFGNKLVRIPKKEDWHITLSFLGYLNDEEIGKLKEIIKKICLNEKSFEITSDKIIWAPPARAKRMIWLDFEIAREFEILKNKIEDELVSLQKQGLFKSFRKENRKTHIHLTLARFREEHFSNIKRFLPEEGIDLKTEASPFLVDKIQIMESFLSREGAEYKSIAEFELKG